LVFLLYAQHLLTPLIPSLRPSTYWRLFYQLPWVLQKIPAQCLSCSKCSINVCCWKNHLTVLQRGWIITPFAKMRKLRLRAGHGRTSTRVTWAPLHRDPPWEQHLRWADIQWEWLHPSYHLSSLGAPALAKLSETVGGQMGTFPSTLCEIGKAMFTSIGKN
jgi:hypothetical protein